MIERYQFVFGIDIIMIGHILFYTCFSTLWNWPIKVLQQHGHKTKTLGQAIMETLCKILLVRPFNCVRFLSYYNLRWNAISIKTDFSLSH